jgi:hypothetical protein
VEGENGADPFGLLGGGRPRLRGSRGALTVRSMRIFALNLTRRPERACAERRTGSSSTVRAALFAAALAIMILALSARCTEACMFARPVKSVSRTRLLHVSVESELQRGECYSLLAYSNVVRQTSGAPNAMVIAAPCAPEELFVFNDTLPWFESWASKALDLVAPPWRFDPGTLGLSAPVRGTGHLPVLRSGGYSYSIAHTPADVERVDPAHLRVSQGLAGLLTARYGDAAAHGPLRNASWCFIVLRFSDKDARFHPFVYGYRSTSAVAHLPALHYHPAEGEEEQAGADWDHDVFMVESGRVRPADITQNTLFMRASLVIDDAQQAALGVGEKALRVRASQHEFVFSNDGGNTRDSPPRWVAPALEHHPCRRGGVRVQSRASTALAQKAVDAAFRLFETQGIHLGSSVGLGNATAAVPQLWVAQINELSAHLSGDLVASYDRRRHCVDPVTEALKKTRHYWADGLRKWLLGLF